LATFLLATSRNDCLPQKSIGLSGYGFAACCEDAALPFRKVRLICPGYALYFVLRDKFNLKG
jgi:hypothetical protein